MEQVTYQLEREGVQSFQHSYESMLGAIQDRLDETPAKS